MKHIELINTYFTIARENDTPEKKYISHLMDTLYKYGAKCEGGHIVEIGVETLISSWAWLKSNPSKITLCDITFNRCKHILPTYINIANDNNIPIILEEKSSLDLQVTDVDLLFIDGKHTYKHVTQELKLLCKEVNGYIIIHDTTKFKGVNNAVMEFLTNNSDFTMIEHIEEFPGLKVLKRVV